MGDALDAIKEKVGYVDGMVLSGDAAIAMANKAQEMLEKTLDYVRVQSKGVEKLKDQSTGRVWFEKITNLFVNNNGEASDLVRENWRRNIVENVLNNF